MSKRLDQIRESKLEPKRMKSTREALEKMGYEIEPVKRYRDKAYRIVLEDGLKVEFWPYSGWFSGKKPIGSGRGFKNLLKKLTKAKGANDE